MRRQRSAFTLTEILIVIALVVLIIAMAVPAFNLITGTRSVDAGENLVSAMLSRARAEAIRSHRVAGVAFFRDLKTERSAMAIVVPASERAGTSDEPAGLEQYKGWRARQEDNVTPTRYYVGDVVIALVPNNNAGGKYLTQVFVCKQEHDAQNDAAHRPPAITTPPTPNTYWGTLNFDEFDTLIGYEYQYLPRGVGAQTINDPDPDPTNPMPTGGRDRYLRNGLVLFDGDGNLLHRSYFIRAIDPLVDTDTTHLFLLMGFDKRPGALQTTAVGQAAAYPLYTQMGVVLYDEETFKTAGGTQEDPTNDNTAYTTATYNEPAEEAWLDNNSLSLMINRYNGTLVRGE